MKTTSFVLLFAILLAACAPAATPVPVTPAVQAPTATRSAPTPIPATATLPPPPTVPPAPAQSSFENILVYDMPEMYQVKVKTLQFQTLHQPPELLAMDVYYPPNWQPGSRLPAVLMANSFPLRSELGNCGRNCYSYPSWGRLIAANGLIAVTYDTKYANDLEALAQHVQANGADLGIDGNRLGVMGVSSDAPLAESFVYQEGRDYVKFGVFYYGYLLTPDNFMREDYNALCSNIDCYGAELSDVKQLRADLPVFVVRSGNDRAINQEPVDRFAQLADKSGVPLTFVRFDEGSHVFDTLESSTGQVRVRAAEIVKQTLEFMKAAASGQPIPTVPAPAATVPPPASTPDLAALQAALDTRLEDLAKQGLTGAVLVARDGQVILSKGYGFADREKKIPFTAQTRIRTGDFTSQLTATAILILAAQGKLSTSDSICQYLADCPAAWKPVTIHHLLVHTSGVPDVWSLPDFESTKATPSAPLQTVARVKDLPLAFQPGTSWSWNNTDSLLLGLVIERVSGQSYEDFMSRNIFEPLQMKDTGLAHNLDGLAVAYESKDSNKLASYIDMSLAFSAGGLYSTVEDLYRWDQALYTERLFPKAYLDKMFTGYYDIPGAGPFGYGWVVATEGGRKINYFYGCAEGIIGYIARYPDQRSTLIVFSNQSALCDFSEIAGVIPMATSKLFETAAPLVPAAPTVAAAATAAAAPLVKETDAMLQKLTTDKAFSGAVLVAQEGKVLLSQGYGFADRQKQLPNTPQTKFRIGHMTEAFTAMAVLILQERGKLNVQDPLCQYIKDCPAAWKDVKLHHLLSLSSGIPEQWPLAGQKADDLIAAAKAEPLLGPPGSKLTWSTTDFLLLGKVIEAVSGQTYEAFVQQNIFEPLQMTSTGYSHGQADLALGYADGGSTAVTPTASETVYSAVALYSTLEDLYRWDEALYTEKLVSQKSLEAMFTGYIASEFAGLNLGYGCSVIYGENPLAQGVMIESAGQISGFSSTLHRYPKPKIAVIVLANQSSVNAWETADAVAEAMFGTK